MIVSVPRDQNAEIDDLRRRIDGKARADIVAWCNRLGGQAVEVVELDQTDGVPEFADCPAWLPSTHPYTGDELLVAAPWRIDGRRPGLRKPAPLLGEGDDYVLRRVLAMSDDEIEALIAAGTVGADDPKPEPGRKQP